MPTKPLERFRDRSPNIDYLNAVRDEASYTYQSQIPEATQANVQEVIQNLDKYKARMNEFVDGLVNLIGLQKFADAGYFQNPMAEFKQGKLERGDTVEEIGLGLLNAYAYDERENVGEGELFSQESIEAQTSFHRINRKEKYKVTIHKPVLDRAFDSEFGLDQMVANILAMPTKSNQRDEFTLMCQLFQQAHSMDAMFNIQIPDITDPTSGEREAKTALRAMREVIGELGFISRAYNPAHLPVSVNPEDLVMLMSPAAAASVDVDGLATLFNIDRGEVPARRKIIPKKFFPEGVSIVITAKDFWQVYDVLFESRSMPNPGGLYDNYWLHVWQIMSFSRFVPIVSLGTGPSSELEIIETPVTSVSLIRVYDTAGVEVAGGELKRGSSYSIRADALTTPENGVNDAVRFEVAGLMDRQSGVYQEGSLLISHFETGETIVVTAFATDDNTKVRTRGFTLTGPIVQQWPSKELPDPTPAG
jgi:hypothetical protein